MIDGVIPSGQCLAEPFELAGRVASSGPASGGAGLVLNVDDYLPMLAEYDITDQQAKELLVTLWNIMRACVELGISVDVCGELGLDAVPVLSTDPASLDSEGDPS